jgi:hypothetical protein
VSALRAARGPHLQGGRRPPGRDGPHLEGSERPLSGDSFHLEGGQRLLGGEGPYLEGGQRPPSGDASHLEGSLRPLGGEGLRLEGGRCPLGSQRRRADQRRHEPAFPGRRRGHRRGGLQLPSHLTEGRDNDIVVSVLPPFDQAGNLPVGIHWASWQEFSERFGMTPHRRRLLVGLREALLALQQAVCSTAYLGGSFVTAEEAPGDFDGCWDPKGISLDKLDPVFLDFSNRRAAQRAKYGGEARCSPPGARQVPPGGHFLSFFSRTAKGIQKGSSLSLFRGCRYDQERA